MSHLFAVLFLDTSQLRQRGIGGSGASTGGSLYTSSSPRGYSAVTWKRIFLLIIAITIHNIPGKIIIFYLCSPTSKTILVTKSFCSAVFGKLQIKHLMKGRSASWHC